MKRSILLIIFLLPMVFAQNSQGQLKDALNNLADTTKVFLGITAMIELAIFLIFAACAIIIYLKKLKGVKEKSTLWMIAAGISVFMAIIFLLGAVTCLVVYFTAPSMVQGMAG